jgi:hypothetical protein
VPCDRDGSGGLRWTEADLRLKHGGGDEPACEIADSRFLGYVLYWAHPTCLSRHRNSHHAGVFDAYLTLKKAYPKAAGALLAAFGMDEGGSY